MKILIIEDEFVSRTKLQKILSNLGECHLAVNGAEALEAFKMGHEEGKPYGLITVDIKLPDMTGPDVVKKIRAFEKESGATTSEGESKILMVTAMSGKNVMASFKEGCEGYIVKPFDSRKIAGELARLGIAPFQL